VSDGHLYARSNELENPAAHLVLESKKSGQSINVWLPPIPASSKNESSPYTFEGKDVQMAYFNGPRGFARSPDNGRFGQACSLMGFVW